MFFHLPFFFPPINFTFSVAYLNPEADGILFSFHSFKSTLCFLILSSMTQSCVMSLGLFSQFRGPWPNSVPPHHSRHYKVTQTRKGAQCCLMSTTSRPFLTGKKGGILMRTLQEDSSRGAVTVFTEQTCFRLPTLQVTAQCSLIGSDCQTLFHLIETPTIKYCPPFSYKILFSCWEWHLMQLSHFHKLHYKLSINIWKWAAFHIYQIISSFGQALVEVHPLLFC